jgi:hypothetical protein
MSIVSNDISLVVYTNIMDICDASLVRQLYICGAAVMQLQDNRKTLGLIFYHFAITYLGYVLGQGLY